MMLASTSRAPTNEEARHSVSFDVSRVRDDFRRVTARYSGPDHAAPDVNLPPGVTYRSACVIVARRS